MVPLIDNMIDVPLIRPMAIALSARGSGVHQLPLTEPNAAASIDEQTIPWNVPLETRPHEARSCDEGMGIFPLQPGVLNSNHWPPALSVATVLWTRAQEKHASNEFECARSLYHQVMDGVVSFTQRTSSGHGLPPPIYDAAFAILIPTLINLGLVAYSNDQWDSAVAYLQLAMTHEMMTHGNDTLILGQVLNCLSVAVWQRSLATQSVTDSDSALFFAYEAYRIYSVPGTVGNPRLSLTSATITFNLGRIHASRAEYTVALTYLNISLQIRYPALGAQHLDTALSTFHVARAYEHVNPTRALACYEQLVSHEALQQSHHCHYYVVALERIAEMHQGNGDGTTALAMWDQCLNAGRRLLKAHRASDLTALVIRVAKVYQERHDSTQALELYQEGLTMLQTTSEKFDDPMLVAVLLSIGEIFHADKNYAKALNVSLQALEIQKKSHGECSVSVALTLRTIGSIHDTQDHLDLALQYFQESLVVQRTLRGDDALEVSDALTDVGSVLCRSNKVSDALHVLTTAHKVRVQHFGYDHRHVSYAICNIGVCHMLQGSHEEAISCFKETLRIESLVLGERHQDVALTLHRISNAFEKIGNTEEAIKFAEQALSIERATRQDEPLVVAVTLNEIGDLHHSLGRWDTMMKAMMESARLFQLAGRDFIGAMTRRPPPLLSQSTEFAAALA